MKRESTDIHQQRSEAQSVLDKVKKSRQHTKVWYERIDNTTWIERSLNPNQFKNNEIMESVTRQQAEEAVAIYRTAKSAKTDYEIQMVAAERIVDSFGREHLGEFTDGRFELDSGTVALKAGTAKPIKDGRPLSTAARIELALQLPPAYVRPSCDFAGLYATHDKTIRQLLKTRDIQIIRDDKFVIL